MNLSLYPALTCIMYRDIESTSIAAYSTISSLFGTTNDGPLHLCLRSSLHAASQTHWPMPPYVEQCVSLVAGRSTRSLRRRLATAIPRSLDWYLSSPNASDLAHRAGSDIDIPLGMLKIWSGIHVQGCTLAPSEVVWMPFRLTVCSRRTRFIFYCVTQFGVPRSMSVDAVHNEYKHCRCCITRTNE